MMNRKTRTSGILYLITFIAFLAGLGLGYLFPDLFQPIAFLGDIYINLLKMIVVPLLMVEIITGVYRAARAFAGRVTRTILLFVGMFVVSFLITAGLVLLIKPDLNLDLTGVSWSGELAAVSLGDFFHSIVPTSIVAAMANGAILPCTLFAFLFGLAAARVQAEKTLAVTAELGAILSKILGYFMYLTPLGVFSLMGNAASVYGTALLSAAGKYILLAWGACLVVSVLVMLLPVWLYARVTPLDYIRRVGQIWLITMSTCSSAATLPHTIRVCNEEFHVSREITDIVVPLGCTIHMCGGAVSFCLLGLVTLQLSGIPLTMGLFLYMLLIATLMNMAAPGIPGGGIVLGATYLTILGAPTGFIGLYSGIYRALDMAYTTLNVTGDITANVLLQESERRRHTQA